MNLKSKIFGVAAATALSLSIMTGAMAADKGEDSANVKGVFNQATCSISVGGALSPTSYSFGEWTWDGRTESYNVVKGNGSVELTYDAVKSTGPNSACAYTVAIATPLTSGANQIANWDLNWGQSNLSSAVSINTGNTKDNFSLNSSAIPTINPGTYTGTLDFTIVAGS